MRKEPTEQQLQVLCKKFFEQLPSEYCDKCRIGESFQKAYLDFIDEEQLPLMMNPLLHRIEKIYFCSKVLEKTEKKSLHKLSGVDVFEMINYYYKHQPTHGAVILNDQRTKYLLVKNRYDKYGFPKGKVQGDESKAQCAQRQIQEEIEIKINFNPESYIQVEDRNRGKCHFYLASINEQDVSLKRKGKKSYEVVSKHWFTEEQVDKIYQDLNILSKLVWKQLLTKTRRPKAKKRKNINFQNRSKRETEGERNPEENEEKTGKGENL